MAPRNLSRVVGVALTAMAIGAVGAASGSIQSAPSSLPSFEVASIKAVPLGRGGAIDFRFQPGRFVATNLTLGQLIEQAYGIEARELIGGPDWVRADRFDVTATTVQAVNRERMALMLRSLLTERFQLRLVQETQTGTIYTLTARNTHDLNAPSKPDERSRVATVRQDGNGFLSYRYDGFNATMAALALVLSQSLRAPVLDQTNLTGNYDFKISWAYDAPFGGLQPDPDVPTIFTALENQVGLRLVAGKGPVPVYVIERVMKPSEN